MNNNIFNSRITAMSAQRFAFVCVNTILLINVLFCHITSANKDKCEILTIPICKNLGYNATYMPDRFNHKTQKDAALDIDKFSPFIKAGCSPMLQLFLCSLYAPACDKDSGKELLPCRSVCENATAGCLILMEDHGVKFPEKMESCDLWPSKRDNKTCVSGLDTRPAIFPSSFALTDKSRGWLALKDKILTTVSLKNSRISFLTIKKLTVTLMLLKNTSLSFFDLEDANLNLLTLATTSSVSHFTVLNTILNSFALINTEVSHFRLTNISMNSLTLMNTTVGHMTMTNNSLDSLTLMNTTVSRMTMKNTILDSLTLMNTTVSHMTMINNSLDSLTLMNTTVGHMTMTNNSLDSLTLINTTVGFLTITNTNMKSFTLTNCDISFLTLINTTMNLYTRTNCSVSWIKLTNSDLPSQTLNHTIPVTTEKPSKNEPSTNTILATTEKLSENDHSSTKTNLGIIIAVSKLQISAYFVLLYSINRFFS